MTRHDFRSRGRRIRALEELHEHLGRSGGLKVPAGEYVATELGREIVLCPADGGADAAPVRVPAASFFAWLNLRELVYLDW